MDGRHSEAFPGTSWDSRNSCTTQNINKHCELKVLLDLILRCLHFFLPFYPLFHARLSVGGGGGGLSLSVSLNIHLSLSPSPFLCFGRIGEEGVTPVSVYIFQEGEGHNYLNV